MRSALRRRLLLAAQTDALARFDGRVWRTRCLHCKAHLELSAQGDALGVTSLEHVVPSAWFGRRDAQALTAQVGGVDDDARNLALACASCNHAKGRRQDARGPSDPHALEIVSRLLATRLTRWREPPPAPPAP
jgi:5-methylcytosine-specific restriction endonuclease McrA